MNLDQRQLDILTELLNMGVGKAAEVLNTILQSHIELRVPSLEILRQEELAGYLVDAEKQPVTSVQMKYSGHFNGVVDLIFSLENASKLVSSLTGELAGEADLDELRAGTLCEVGNIVINSLMGTLSNLLALDLTYTVPTYSEGLIEQVFPAQAPGLDGNLVLLAKTSFLVKELEIDGNIAVFFTLATFENLVTALESFVGG